MKDSSLLFAVTADQRRSRTSDDRVPQALTALQLDGLALAFERTAGDEIQGLTARPDVAVLAVTRLARLGDWRIGLGVGPVELPLPESTRAARGGAYLAARSAIDAASAGFALRVDERAADPSAGRRAETALLALITLLSRRSAQGWEVADLVGAGTPQVEIAAQLGISPSAVSQRLTRSDHALTERLAELSSWLLGELTRTEATQ